MFERIACIGGATIDRKVEALGRLLPGTSNPVRSETCFGGTARNIAEALARLGCPVTLFSRVGQDAGGQALLDELTSLGVDVGGVDRSTTSPTASYAAVLNQRGELAIGLADMEILDTLSGEWLAGNADRLAGHDLWIIDANLPADLFPELLALLPATALLYADPVSVDKSERLRSILGSVDTIFPDRREAAALAELDPATAPERLGAALARLGPRRSIITLGAKGVWVEDPPRHQPVAAAPAAAVVDVTGAGDCLVAGYVFAQTVAAAIDPIRCGLACASLAIESRRTVPERLTAERALARYKECR